MGIFVFYIAVQVVAINISHLIIYVSLHFLSILFMTCKLFVQVYRLFF